MKNFAKMAACAALALTCIASSALAESAFDATKLINVISREDGSGTRGAFIELTGVQQEVDGQDVDMTTVDAQITNNTAVMLTTVAGDTYAIGYVSLGSLSDDVKAVNVEGVEATVDWLASARVDGAVQGLQQLCHEAEEDTCAILERKLSLSDHEKRVLRKFVHAGMKRLVRSPILTLKGLRDEEEQETYMRAVERLFCLEEEPPAGREGGGV